MIPVDSGTWNPKGAENSTIQKAESGKSLELWSFEQSRVDEVRNSGAESMSNRELENDRRDFFQ